MSDDFEDTPRAKKKKGSGDNTLKIVLIVLVSFFGVSMLVCCGVGVYVVNRGINLVEQAAKELKEGGSITNPADIEKLKSEIADITIPPEFMPQHASSLFGVKMVHYRWCPAGNCMPTDLQNLEGNFLSLTTFKFGDDVPPPDDAPLGDDDSMSDEVLKQSWKEFTKTEHTFDIRGKATKFYVIQGEEFATPQYDPDEDEMPAEAESTGQPPATTPPVTREGTGKKIVHVSGSFPGKLASCTLQVRLNAGDYDEAKILEMLKSIK